MRVNWILEPPPNAIIKLLHSNPRILPPNVSGISGISEEMIKVFKTDVDGNERKGKRLIDRRNWSSIDFDGEGLSVQLHVEGLDKQRDAVIYTVRVPPIRA
jgi:hypothetical protein